MLYLIFTTIDVCKRGKLVFNVVKDFKNDYDKIWFVKDNQDLIDLCKNIIIDETLNTVVINSQTSNDNSQNSTSTTTLSYADILKLNKENLDELKKLISSHNYLNQSNDNKNNHYNDLKTLIDKYQLQFNYN